MQIVLVEPEIPPNTGNIARLCAATGTVLHLIEPLGFRLEDRYLKRAGLDYWPKVAVFIWKNWSHFEQGTDPQRLTLRTDPDQAHQGSPSAEREARGRLIMVSSKRRPQSRPVQVFPFLPSDMLVFGPETRGLTDDVLALSPWHVRVPMKEDSVRSLNLSTCAGIVLYMALARVGLPPSWC